MTDVQTATAAVRALQKFLELETIDEARELIDEDRYLVLTDKEADEEASRIIIDSLWAFNSSFIADHVLNVDDYDSLLKSIESIQEQCEGANDAIRAMIQNVEDFAEDAISCDGRGHFINHYDGSENEETIDSEVFYIYRIN